MEPAGINAQLHAIAASDDAVDVLVHEHFSAYFLARDGLHLNLKGNRRLLRGITGAIHHIRHVIIDLPISIVSGLAIVNDATKNTTSPIYVQNTNTSSVSASVRVGTSAC